MPETTKERELDVRFKRKRVTLEQKIREDRLNFIGVAEDGKKYFVKLWRCKEDFGFLRERDALSALAKGGGHPNVLTEHDSGTTEDGPSYVVYPYEEKNLDLGYLIRKKGLSPEQACKIFLNACRGLEYIHSSRVIHRDIKPGNIIVKASRDEAFVIDFNFAFFGEESYDEKERKDGKTIFGTPSFVAPEVWLDIDYGCPSDIYSLGITLFELFTGAVPFDDKSATKIALKHINEAVPDPRDFNQDIPVSLVNVINKALAKNPKSRFKSATEFAYFFSEAVSGDYSLLDTVKYFFCFWK